MLLGNPVSYHVKQVLWYKVWYQVGEQVWQVWYQVDQVLWYQVWEHVE
jgi:hypothetical protein